jgi:2-haloacid dehalogenase
MVAAHPNDLSAAAACGLRTTFVSRPNEQGPGKGAKAPTTPTDITVASVEELAGVLGV